MEEEKPKVQSLEEILNQKKTEPLPRRRTIAVPVGVGSGMGAEIKKMYKIPDPRYQPDDD